MHAVAFCRPSGLRMVDTEITACLEDVVAFVWPHLTPQCRNHLFFTAQGIRACVLQTARRFTVSVYSQPGLEYAWGLMATASQPALPDTWMQRIMHARHITCCLELRHDWMLRPGNDPAPTCSIPALPTGLAIPRVTELLLNSHHHFPQTTADIAAIAARLPGLRLLRFTDPWGTHLAPLPADSFPHLHTLLVEDRYTPTDRPGIQPGQTTFVQSITPYLPQLSTLQLPKLAPGVACLTAPAPQLHTLTLITQLSDELLDLLNQHAPNLHTLGVTELPTAPLQQPCRLHTVVFNGYLPDLLLVNNVPATVGRVVNIMRLPSCLVHRLTFVCNTDADVEVYLRAAARITYKLSDLHAELAPRHSAPNDLQQLERQLKVLRGVLGLWDRPENLPDREHLQLKLVLAAWVASPALLAMLRTCAPARAHDVTLRLAWQAGEDHSGVLQVLPWAGQVAVHTISDDDQELSLEQLQAMLAGAPAERHTLDPAFVIIHLGPRHSGSYSGVSRLIRGFNAQWARAGSKLTASLW